MAIEQSQIGHPISTPLEADRYPDRGTTAMPSIVHGRACLVAHDMLVTELEPDALVAMELTLYPRRDEPKTFLVPDVLVALGVGQADPSTGELRNVYRAWDEGKPPDLVIEMASKSTVGRDKVGKKEDYARYGISEYVQFDPTGTLLVPHLWVWRLAGNSYQEVARVQGGGIPSAVLLGLEWVQVGGFLRLRGGATGELLPAAAEKEAAGRVRAERLAALQAARADAEAAARLRAERLAGQQASRANEEATRADAEAARADAETAARLRAEELAIEMKAELARLRAMISGQGG